MECHYKCFEGFSLLLDLFTITFFLTRAGLHGPPKVDAIVEQLPNINYEFALSGWDPTILLGKTDLQDEKKNIQEVNNWVPAVAGYLRGLLAS